MHFPAHVLAKCSPNIALLVLGCQDLFLALPYLLLLGLLPDAFSPCFMFLHPFPLLSISFCFVPLLVLTFYSRTKL